MNAFFTDPDFEFTTRCAIGYAAQGVLDVGEVFATIALIENGNADSWYAAWRAKADKLHARATTTLAAGNSITASRQFLAAAESYSQAIGFSDRMTDPGPFDAVFALHRESWDAFVDADRRIERVAVPYNGATLPGYLVRPDSSGAARPTVVLTNGSDGSISALWATGASTAIERGFNAFLYDGPGQQSMLFQENVPFRHDWEAVLTPVVDALVARTDVDASALFAYGVSQAGYWVTRALAFEHRFAAAAVDPGVVDVATSWLEHLPTQLVDALKAGDSTDFNAAMTQVGGDPRAAQTMAFRARPYLQETPFDTFTAALQYNAKDVAGQISTPLLITSPDNEQFWPGQSEQLAALLTVEHEVVHFSTADGADSHCEPMGRMAAEFAMFDFYSRHLPQE